MIIKHRIDYKISTLLTYLTGGKLPCLCLILDLTQSYGCTRK